MARNVREQEQDARPDLATAPPSLDPYDVVLLGCPVWNVRAPMIMHTLLDQLDLEGKTIMPFVTYAVSGMGRVADDYATAAPAAEISDGLAIQGEEAQDAGSAIDQWLQDARL